MLTLIEKAEIDEKANCGLGENVCWPLIAGISRALGQAFSCQIDILFFCHNALSVSATFQAPNAFQINSFPVFELMSVAVQVHEDATNIWMT